MIRKLRWKFVGISMGSLVLVLGLLIGLINFLNYRDMIEGADQMLDLLSQNGGGFPDPAEIFEFPGEPEAQNASEEERGAEDETASGNQNKAEPQNYPEDGDVREEPDESAILNAQEKAENTEDKTADGNQDFPDRNSSPGQPFLSPETPYETRFFVVWLDSDGAEISADLGMVAAVDEETAVGYAQTAWQKGKNRGSLSIYRYCMTEESDASAMLVFLDCSKTQNACRSFLLTSAGVAVFGVLIVFALTFVLSGIVVKPFYESYEKQKRFITDAGHEIRTPLTILDADIDVLIMESGKSEWLEDMQVQTKRLTDLTNELIYLARLEEDSRRVQMIDLPFSDLAEETAQSFQSLARVKNKTFITSIQPLVMVCGDGAALRRLVFILLDNAVKYSNENGTIRLCLEKNGRMARLTVENTVDSISKESISHIFERFYRADASRNSRQGGYGIGLSIAEAIVKSHRGEISAMTRDGKSLIMTVELRLAESMQAPE